MLVNAAKTLFTGWLPELWLFALGGLFIGVTLLLPKGIVGLVRPRPAPTLPPVPVVSEETGVREAEV